MDTSMLCAVFYREWDNRKTLFPAGRILLSYQEITKQFSAVYRVKDRG